MDTVFMVTNDGAAGCVDLKNNIATVNKDNYTFADNTLTIKKEYLSGLSNGDKIFTLKLDDGNSLTFNITVAE